jgi:ACT domain-containing protein
VSAFYHAFEKAYTLASAFDKRRIPDIALAPPAALLYDGTKLSTGGDVAVVKAIVTVIGVDRVGIIARVSALLAQREVNILDINQTVMQEYFTMVMMVDVGGCNVPFETLKADLLALGEELGMRIHAQHQDIFDAMHRI